MKALRGILLATGLPALAACAGETPVVLFPFREATASAQVESTLKPLRLKIGERFKAGGLIAELDDAKYAIEFARAKEQRDFAARTAKEKQELKAKEFASEFDARKADYEAKLAETAFQEAELNLNRCKVHAPFDGRIAELLTHEYETVKPGQALFRIIEDHRLLAVANVTIGSLKVGDRVRISFAASAEGAKAETSVGATVYDVAPQADNRTGTVRIRALVENGKGTLVAGMTGRMQMD